MCPEAVSLFEGSSFKAGALSLASHYLLSQLHSTRQKCDVYEPGLRVNTVFTYTVFTDRVEKKIHKELAILQQN